MGSVVTAVAARRTSSKQWCQAMTVCLLVGLWVNGACPLDDLESPGSWASGHASGGFLACIEVGTSPWTDILDYREGRNELTTGLHPSLLTDRGHHVTICSSPLLQRLPCQDEL